MKSEPSESPVEAAPMDLADEEEFQRRHPYARFSPARVEFHQEYIEYIVERNPSIPTRWLYRRLQDRGYRGSLHRLRRYLREVTR
jgi:hypothetical protein